ncbi:unnamed protein product, partial [marine sediment metagenome]
ITQEDLAKTLSVPVDIITFLEDPVEGEARIVELLAGGLGITPEVFKGELPPEPKEPTEEEKKEAVVKNARFPNIRQFILDPSRCENPEKALELFGNQELSLAEKNVILYLSTTALYSFCDTNTSSFAFDEYLFKLHGPLLAEFEKELQGMNISTEEKEDRLGNARSNIFACDTVENIAIRVVEQFAGEMEEKISNSIYDFEDDLDMPFLWNIDETLMKIDIKDQNGTVKDQIKLLDVRERA